MSVIKHARLDWIHGVLLGGVFAIILFVLMGHSSGVCH